VLQCHRQGADLVVVGAALQAGEDLRGGHGRWQGKQAGGQGTEAVWEGVREGKSVADSRQEQLHHALPRLYQAALHATAPTAKLIGSSKSY
jgi:hypothetical protein